MKFSIGIFRGVNCKKVINHATCWMLLIGYELYAFYLAAGRLPSLLIYSIYYTCNISLFYCHLKILNFALNRTKPNYVKLLVLVITEVIFYVGIKISVDLLFPDFSRSTSLKFDILKAMAVFDLMRVFYFGAFATLYWAINNINHFQNKADAAEISRLKAANDNADLAVRLAKSQNAYLQQQINPHLLFSSLGFIHSSVNKLSHEAAENITLLSDIMRYSLEETDADGKIALEKEAAQIENLIKINRFRFDYHLDISYITEGSFAKHKIIPLVLMTLVENLFKHGDLSNKQATIKLTVKENGALCFYTFNHKRPQPFAKRIKSIGIENIKIRLNYTYGPDYKLTVNQTDETYESELTLQL